MYYLLLKSPVSGSTYVLATAWQSMMTPNLLAQVCVNVAPKRNTLPLGFCAVYDVLLSVGADGKNFVSATAPNGE